VRLVSPCCELLPLSTYLILLAGEQWVRWGKEGQNTSWEIQASVAFISLNLQSDCSKLTCVNRQALKTATLGQLKTGQAPSIIHVGPDNTVAAVLLHDLMSLFCAWRGTLPFPGSYPLPENHADPEWLVGKECSEQKGVKEGGEMRQ